MSSDTRIIDRIRENLTIERISEALDTLNLSDSGERSFSYMMSYPEFLTYFENCEEITWHDFIIGSHFTYGWMPTIIKLPECTEKDKNEVIRLLEIVRTDFLLAVNDLETLKKYVNNSMVGLSKLLHFIAPDKYAIWDSNIYKFIMGDNSAYHINKPEIYIEYLSRLRIISSDKYFNNLKKVFKEKFNMMDTTRLSDIRIIELIMFERIRQNNAHLSKL